MVAISTRRVRSTLDRDNGPVKLFRRCVFCLDVHETAAGEVTAVKRSTRRAG
jgi:hypothetical protein